ncbi:efflux RND transporter periplasmic adaptor subunit [Halalkalibaculum sp. DA3122]|uniref:efflux RND transporter periplasmic adaptor subunit n=1 Tax=unclassified Halalkalibaculum TaxID=2964617 RepID=UPI0037552DF7
MKKWLKITIGIIVIGAVGMAVFAMVQNDNTDQEEVKTVEVNRSKLQDIAIAVGAIEPRVEVDVKSKISGVVEKLYAEAGEYIEAGEPLMEIKPTPTPQELVDARRELERMQLSFNNAETEFERISKLKEKGLIADRLYEETDQSYQQARVNLQAARERLDLIEKGSITTYGQEIKSVVTAPISGYILEKAIEIGDPVVPLTSYQEGTVLMTMADMDDLLFRGTVDEIDVGKLQEGMQADIKIGALPDAEVRGVLSKISLKSRDEDNTIVFPIEIMLTDLGGNVLRAGYSANAEIMVEERDNVLTIPERLITFRGDTAHVNVLLADGSREDRVIEMGLSDAINVEVKEGLAEGEKVIEKEAKEIE